MSTTDNETNAAPAVGSQASIDLQFKLLSERVAKTSDSDLKEFLSGILKATEITLVDMRSMRERLEKVQANADAAAAAAQTAKRDATDRVVRADIRAEAQAAGAIDAADVLQFIGMGAVQIGDDGRSNIPELINGLKKNKPHLFGKVSTSATHPVPKPGGAGPRNALEMTPGEYRAAKARFTKR